MKHQHQRHWLRGGLGDEHKVAPQDAANVHIFLDGRFGSLGYTKSNDMDCRDQGRNAPHDANSNRPTPGLAYAALAMLPLHHGPASKKTPLLAKTNNGV